MPSVFPRRLLFPRMSGPARLAAVLWLLTAIAVGAILIVATLRPAAAAGPLDIIAPTGQPVGQLMALGVVTGAAIIGCVGAILFVGAGGHPRRRRI
ncbi:hypothetical protein G3545_14230 [Starkeya sp. ORNL1]|uniref:hypothetical protein n=1 Tax=Starkeya sp. ORNL1 TaxID=2709380 RepID=UPI001462B8EC|nr:hypothetical protein [Starkeya sp. ORNL1]QJP14700.1 hypothetical protein G3545_14230 [Starkeya sp. ORNL1]